ncbi:MAG TPA: type II toxin-antitoxin system HicB family antitoxin [Burkholderiaceae bacterium]|nr:type II toxin-antitoxin system HicB family antitoxin [Burkholderiaceae bacterium]
MSDLLEYKGYQGSVGFSAEDHCFFGKIELINDLISFDGSGVDEITAAFHQAVDDYLAFCQKTRAQPNQPFKGSFNVRVTPALHWRTAVEVKKRGITLDQFIGQSIERMLDGDIEVHDCINPVRTKAPAHAS